MRFYAFALMVSTTLVQQQCDIMRLAQGQAVEEADKAVKAYFPDAKAVMDARRRTLTVSTCANLGRAAVEMMPDALTPKLAPLSSLGARLFASIDAFELGFSQYILRYDVTTRTYSIHGSLPGYAREYGSSCGTSAPPPTYTLSTDNQPMIYVGTLRVSLHKETEPNVPIIKTEVRDTLGIYTPAAFEIAKGAEMESRRKIIGEEFAKSGYTLADIELVAVERVPLTQRNHQTLQ